MRVVVGLCAGVVLLGATARGEQHVSLRGKIVAECYWEAFGRGAELSEVRHWEGRRDWKDKAALLEFKRAWLRTSEAEARGVVDRSYKWVFGRPPARGEVDHWLPHARKGLLWFELVGHHQKHVRDSAAAAIQANPALMARLTGAGLRFDASRNVVRGTGELVLKAGDYLVGPDGASIVAAGAGNVVGHNGAALIGADGSTVKGRTLMSVGGSRIEAGTLLLDRNGNGLLKRK